jgi:hypothetical protein
MVNVSRSHALLDVLAGSRKQKGIGCFLFYFGSFLD